MNVFQYKGVDANGRGVDGKIEAGNERLAYELLTGRGIIPLTIHTSVAGQPQAAPRLRKALFGKRIPFASRAVFVRELGTFIHADIPLLEALEVLRRQEHNPAFKEVLDDLHERVQGGEAFSKALTNYPKIFSPLLISMVKVGETGGVMGPVLDQMATWMENEEEVRGEITSALAYPAMILLLGGATVLILVTFVLPRISTIFAGMEANLPLPTKILMQTSAFMGRWWWMIPIALVGIFMGTRQAMRTRLGRNLYDRLSLSVPIFGPLTRKAAIARFARANSALLSAGVPLMEALRVVRGLLGNALLAAMVDQTIAGVTKGRSMALMLEESPYFPPAAIHLLRVGERTGRLAEMFNRVAQTFEKQTRNQIKVMLNLLSPIMIVALAVLVGLIAISILLPIFQMNKMMR